MVRHTTRDGRRLFVQGNTTVIKDSGGNVTGTLGVLRDITDHKRAEEALRESEQTALTLVAKLEETDKNKNQFFNVLSHELRNPLEVIVASLSLLEVASSPELVASTNEILKNQVVHLTKLVDDLLDLTRINQNKIKLKKENVYFNELIGNLKRDMMPEYVELKSTVLIALSGYSGEDDMKRTKESGFNRHLAKPVDRVALEKVLAEIEAV